MPSYLNKLLSALQTFFPLVLSVLTGIGAYAQSNLKSSKPIHVQIEQEGFAIGFSDTLKSGGKPFWFEASAILYDGKSLLVAHDKPMPDGRSSVGYWPGLADMTLKPPVYFTDDVFKRGIKYEELAQTPDRKWIFATTAFDRVKEGSADSDGYNLLLCWPAGKPSKAQVRRLKFVAQIAPSDKPGRR